MANKFVSEPIAIDHKYRNTSFYRADIQLRGVDHSGNSYEGRVFLNNPDANEDTPTTLEAGFAASFFIFGHGGCYGDAGHCEIRARGTRPFDRRTLHPLLPVDIAVTVTDAFRQAVAQGESLTVTIVPVVHSPDDDLDDENCLRFSKFDLMVYS